MESQQLINLNRMFQTESYLIYEQRRLLNLKLIIWNNNYTTDLKIYLILPFSKICFMIDIHRPQRQIRYTTVIFGEQDAELCLTRRRDIYIWEIFQLLTLFIYQVLYSFAFYLTQRPNVVNQFDQILLKSCFLVCDSCDLVGNICTDGAQDAKISLIHMRLSRLEHLTSLSFDLQPPIHERRQTCKYSAAKWAAIL